jgi:hypothetical protein
VPACIQEHNIALGDRMQAFGIGQEYSSTAVYANRAKIPGMSIAMEFATDMTAPKIFLLHPLRKKFEIRPDGIKSDCRRWNSF